MVTGFKVREEGESATDYRGKSITEKFQMGCLYSTTATCAIVFAQITFILGQVPTTQ